MRALTRRQRIQRAISPAPMPEYLLPVMASMNAHYGELHGYVQLVEARQDTLETVTSHHIGMIEQTWPERFRNVRDALALLMEEAKNYARLSADNLQAMRVESRFAVTLRGRTLASRLRWLLVGE